MPKEEAAQTGLNQTCSRIGHSLIRLRKMQAEHQAHEIHGTQLFHSWQQQWGKQNRRIAVRLQAIDAQLSSQTEPAPATIRLSVVGVPDEVREAMTLSLNSGANSLKTGT